MELNGRAVELLHKIGHIVYSIHYIHTVYTVHPYTPRLKKITPSIRSVKVLISLWLMQGSCVKWHRSLEQCQIQRDLEKEIKGRALIEPEKRFYIIVRDGSITGRELNPPKNFRTVFGSS